MLSPAFICRRAKTRRCILALKPRSAAAARSKQVEQVLDATNREAYRQRDPFILAGTDLGGLPDNYVSADAQGR